jgi:4-amino-4-deoxy-L-arabinose transferase-like glycosyltransferase
MQKVSEIIEQRPGAVFAAFLALHFGIWTALPAILYVNLPLDLIEALIYGREWQLGYDKLPPLPWWLVEITYRLFGRDVFYYALAQLTVLSAFAVVWTMARQLVGAVGALVAVLIIDGLHYFTFTAPKFNHDVIQLPFWALTGYAYWAALRHGRTMHWILLGIAAGISLWAKYFIVILAAPLVLFMLLDARARKTLTTPGPWIAAAAAAVVMAPHIVWLLQNDFLPFAYVDARATHFHGVLDYIVKPPWFSLLQLGHLLPSLLIAAPYLRRDVRADEPLPGVADEFDCRIVSLLAFGPAAAITFLSLVSGRNAVPLWGYPLWLFLGLWFVMTGRALDRVTLYRIVFLWGTVQIAVAAAFILHYTLQPRLNQRYRAELFPGDRLGSELSRRFRALTGQPPAYVIGSMWDGGNVSHYAPERPRVLIDGNPRRAPWIDLGDLRLRGAIVVWTDAGDPRVVPPAFRAIAADAEVQPPFFLPFHVGGPVVRVGWALLRPQAAAPAVGQDGTAPK